MPGNSPRPGARRKPGSKKGPVVGSGGQKPKGLRGRGATPPASERTGHPAARRAASAARRVDTGRQLPRRATTRATRASRDGAEVIVGRNPVVEALRVGLPATALLVAARIDVDDRVREAVDLAGQRSLPLLETTRAELDRLAGGAVHQGLVLQVPPYDYRHPLDLVEVAAAAGAPALIVALDSVTDPRNVGAVIRSTAAFGGHGVVVPTRRSAGVTATAWKASAGAAARVPVARAANLTRALVDYQHAGLTVVGLDVHGAVDIRTLPAASDPLVLVVGSEDRGLSRLVRETADLVASIPIAHATESLNASVAASIALYEVARSRRGLRQ